MRLIKIGKYVNTHGVKGEIRIQSNFEKKQQVFQKGKKLYINNQLYIIKSYRVHKEFDMVTFEDVNSINDIEAFKGMNVYINYEDLNLIENEVLISDMIGYEVYVNNKLFSKVQKIENNNAYNLLFLENNKYIPYLPVFIKKIDIASKRIDLNEVGGLTDEN